MRAPCHFAKQGNEVRLILAPGAHNQSRPIPTLVTQSLKGRLGTSGSLRAEVCTTRVRAKRTGFNENYIPRILDLAVLSPEMTEAIFGGDHDPLLTVAQLIARDRVDATGTTQIDDFGQEVPCGSMPIRSA